MMAIQAALDEAGKVVKRQKTCETKVEQCLDQLISLVSKSKAELQGPSSFDADMVIQRLNKQIEDTGSLKDLSSQTKDLHSAINKLGKAVEKAFDGQPDICKALRDVQMDPATLDQVMAEHFYREGRFELGDSFAKEAGLRNPEAIKQPYISMHSILKEIKAHNLEPALKWATEHQHQLCQDGSPSAFEFKLHSLNFINILKMHGQQAALAYAKQHFQPFQGKQLKGIQRLMGCLLFYNKPLGHAQYQDLLSPAMWDDVAQEFTRQACSLMGQAYESPLAVAVAAGAAALPGLLKLASVMEKNLQDLKTCGQLPVELELGAEFVFHSIFACPVSRDQSSSDNPPMLLPCNHVLCEQSVLKIAKSRTRIFKCPYCPMEARADNLRPLFFPDVE